MCWSVFKIKSLSKSKLSNYDLTVCVAMKFVIGLEKNPKLFVENKFLSTPYMRVVSPITFSYEIPDLEFT